MTTTFVKRSIMLRFERGCVMLLLAATADRMGVGAGARRERAMTEETKLYCPLLVSSQTRSVIPAFGGGKPMEIQQASPEPCCEEACAWWLNDKCAILAIADKLNRGPAD